MKCRKKAFKDKTAAVIALHLIQNHNDGRKKPVRAYECEKCLHWHLTSKAIDTELQTNYKAKLDWSNLIMKRSEELINQERERQINAEGWTLAHDDMHTDAELFEAGVCYLNDCGSAEVPKAWPWGDEFWKPTYRHGIQGHIRQLVKAGALFKAEKQRILRSGMPLVYSKLIVAHIDAFSKLCQLKLDDLLKD